MISFCASHLPHFQSDTDSFGSWHNKYGSSDERNSYSSIQKVLTCLHRESSLLLLLKAAPESFAKIIEYKNAILLTDEALASDMKAHNNLYYQLLGNSIAASRISFEQLVESILMSENYIVRIVWNSDITKVITTVLSSVSHLNVSTMIEAN